MSHFSNQLEKILCGIILLGVMIGLVVGVAQPQSTVQAVTKTESFQSGFRIFADFTDPCGPDSHEPDNTYLQANLIATDGTQQSRTNPVATDADWVYFNAISGHTYQIRTILTNDINQGDNLANDTLLYLFAPNGTTQLAFNDDVGNTTWYQGAYYYRESIITWTAPSTAQYYIEETQWNTSARGCHTYNLWVTDLNTTPPNQLSITKSANPTFFTAAGQSITYTYRVTNTGINDLTSPTVTDNKFTPQTVTCGTSPLYHGFTASCSRTYTTTAADVTTGLVTNTATASGIFGGTTYTSNSASTTINLASLNLAKTANPTFFIGSGQNITYTYTLTNTGTVVLTSPYTISDNRVLPGNINCAGATSPLNPGESTTCTGTYTTTAADVTARFVTNTASASAAYGLFTIPSNSTSATINLNQTPIINPQSFSIAENSPNGTVVGTVIASDPDAGDTLTYAIIAGNTGPTFDINPASGQITVANNILLDFSINPTFNLTVQVTDTGLLSSSATVTITVSDILPDISVTKVAGTLTVPETGGPVTYTYTVTNNSTEAATITALSDDQFGPLAGDSDCQVSTDIAGGANCSFDATFSVPAGDFPGTHVNIFSATVTDNDGNNDTATDDATVTYTDVLPIVVLTKSAVPTSLPIPGGDFIFTLEIANNGLEEFMVTGITDSNSTSTDFSDCSDLIGDTLAADTSVSCTYTVNYTDVGTYTNTSNVTVEDNEGNSTSDTDSETVEVTDVIADLAITKSDSTDPVEVNQQITYTLEVSNAGPDAAINVSVVDDLPSEVIHVSSSGTGWSCSYDIPTHSVTCMRGNLSVGTAPDITITVTAPSSPAMLQNTATVSALSSDPDPDNNSDTENTLIIQSDPNAIVKTLADTSEDFTTGSNVAIGEVLNYEVVITIPPGTFDSASVVDTLDQGLAFVACDSLTPSSAGLTASSAFADICANPGVAEYPSGSTTEVDQGRQATYDFGTLINSTTGDITLTIIYRVVVLNAIQNQQDADPPVLLNNAAVFNWENGTPISGASEPVSIVEPDLEIQKTASPTFVRVGDLVTYTITIRHTGDSNTNAYDTLMQDVVPVELGIILATLNCNAGGQNADTCGYDAGTRTVAAGWDNFTLSGGTGVVRFQATVLSLPTLGGVTNTAAVEWTSLPGDPGQISPHNDLSTERYYDPGDPANTYGVEASFTLNALIRGAPLPATGFAPGVVTKIGPEPQGLYSPQNDLNLEIPALKVKLPVMGIPLQNGTWDLAWLSSQAGWLEGTAYPTLDGNSVLTAHVYLPNGQPGPFIDLGKLSWGQEIAVVSNGLRYVYQVREVARVNPNNMSVFRHEEKPWLTLLTCKEYDEITNSYRSRLVVRAVLLRVENLTE